MKKLPKYFAIKLTDDPRWGDYIKYLNKTYLVGLEGIATLYPYYGFGGSNNYNDIYEASPSHFPNTPTVLTLDEFFECIGSNNGQDAKSNFPEKWCIKDGLHESVTKFFNKNGTSHYTGNTKDIFHYPAYNRMCLYSNKLPGYTEISLAEFQEHVLKEKPNKTQPMKNTIVKKSELEKIHNVACLTWKS